MGKTRRDDGAGMPMLDLIIKTRRKLLHWVRARNSEGFDGRKTTAYLQVDAEEQEQLEFIDDPPGLRAVPQVFRQFCLQRAQRTGVQWKRMARTLGYRSASDYHEFQKFLSRPLGDIGVVRASLFVDLSVMLECDVEVLLQIALKQEGLHREAEIRDAVRVGTSFTGPNCVRSLKADAPTNPIPELPRGR